ncbi:MAG: META domain-containing protein [Chitinophagaceae bacterium]|nr:META domain-containing protein [Chitinophagaceae bacterium]
MKLITFMGVGAFIVMSACVMQKEVAKDQQSLYDTKWNLKKIHTGSKTEEVNTKAFIKFDKEKGSAGGNGSCNSFGSNAVANENKVSFSNIFSTKMYCEGVQQTEDTFFKQLEKVNRFEIKNKTLLLYQDKYLLLEFEAE